MHYIGDIFFLQNLKFTSLPIHIIQHDSHRHCILAGFLKAEHDLMIFRVFECQLLCLHRNIFLYEIAKTNQKPFVMPDSYVGSERYFV